LAKKPLSQLGPDLRAIAQNLEEPDPESVHEELLDWQSGFTLAQEQRVGPSLKEPDHANHVFNMVGSKAEIGSSLPYARAYQAYRVRSGQVDFFALDEESADKLLSRITTEAFEKEGWNGGNS